MEVSSPASEAPSLTPSEGQKRSCTCAICGVQLSRPAHLRRHLKRHSSAADKTFRCQLCDRTFSRKDVYQRHKRLIHDTDGASRRSGRRKSCHRCIKYKLRCSRELPCRACRNNPEQCVYNCGGPPQGTQEDGESSGTGAVLQREYGNLGDLNDLANAAGILDRTLDSIPGLPDEANNRHDVPVNTPPAEPLGVRIPATCASSGAFAFTMPSTLPGDLPLPLGYDLDVALDGVQESLQACGDQRPRQQHIGTLEYDARLHDESDSGRFGVGFLNFPPDSLRFDIHGWDTLLGGDTEGEGSTVETQGATEPQTNIVQSESSNSENVRDHGAGMSLHGCSAATQGQHGAVNPGSVENKQYWPGVLDQGGNETWPFDYTSNKGFRRIKLPPLKLVLEETVASRPTIEKSILGDLIKVLSAPQIPSLNDTPALEVMPAVAFLGEFTRVYFAEFHNIYPIIHIPTWRIEKCATHLLAAMACLGAMYSTTEGSSDVSTLFAEITQRALFWTGQQDSSAFRNPAYISASCFHQIYALGTGNRRLYEIADASRGLLVTSLRGLGILSSESSISSMSDLSRMELRNLDKMNNSELQDAWLAWRDKESMKRMAWSVFEFDCVLSTTTSKKPAFRISELPPRLPCNENIWEAHSARAWAALVSFATSPTTGLPFYTTLREIIATGKARRDIPAWAMRICAVAVGRVLYDLKEMQDASAPRILGIPSMANAYHETRRTLLAGLESLAASLGKPNCTADVVNMNILNLTCHRSHLISSGDETMDLVISIFRSSGQDSGQVPTQSAKVAKERLVHVFRTNPVNNRRLVRHAAIIIAITRSYTINTPCETLSVFMGYAFLLAYVRFSPFGDDTAEGPATTRVRLDGVPWLCGPDSLGQVERWIEHGGRASLGPVENICDRQSFGAIKQEALNALAGLSICGLSRKFSQTVQKFI